jgi:hypothetical protein
MKAYFGKYANYATSAYHQKLKRKCRNLSGRKKEENSEGVVYMQKTGRWPLDWRSAKAERGRESERAAALGGRTTNPADRYRPPTPTNPAGARRIDRPKMAEEVDAAAVAAGAAVQLIDGEGGFAADSAERFMAAAGVAGCGLSYAVVSIMGPQSSGTCVRYVLRSVDQMARSRRHAALAGHLFDQMLRLSCADLRWASALRPICCVLCILGIGRSARLTARLMRL